MTYRILRGDCLEVLRTLPASSVDAVVTDPPAGISFMGREWDHHKGGMNPWVEWMMEVMREALRVCKPGAHALVWALPRTSHWTGSALELAGWQVRDVVTHMFGSGFPKSHNLDGGLGTALKPAAEFWWLARKPLGMTVEACVAAYGTGALNIDACRIGDDLITAHGGGQTGDHRAYKGDKVNGQGIPAIEAGSNPHHGRWPANVVLGHSEGCVPTGTRRVKAASPAEFKRGDRKEYGNDFHPRTPNETFKGYADADGLETVTAWECEPGCPVRQLDEQTGNRPGSHDQAPTVSGNAAFGGGQNNGNGYGDSGGSSRFFAQFNHTEEPQRFRYVAKSSSAERNAGLDGFEKREGADGNASLGTMTRCALCGLYRVSGHERQRCTCDAPEWVSSPRANVHPTVKPIELMRWLIRLVTPPNGGVVLDPFLGSGSTGCAAVLERVEFIGIERDAEYLPIAEARIKWWSEHPDGMQLVKRLEHEAERKAVAESGQTSMFDMLAEEPPASPAGNGREGEASADRRYTERGASNFAMKPGRRRS